MNFFNFQLSKFKEIKNIATKSKDLNRQYYFQSWSINLGFIKLINLFNDYSYLKNLTFILKVIKDQILFKKRSYKLKNLNINKNYSYKNLFVTWYNYTEHQYYYDKYFDIKLNKKNTLNFLINHNQSNESKHNNSIIYKVKNYNELNVFDYIHVLTNFIIFLVTKKFKTYDKFETHIADAILKIVKKYNIQKIIMPYEAQLFQKKIINIVKNYNKKIVIIGYLHSSIPAFPIEFVKTQNNTDAIYVHGINHKKILMICGWKNKEVKSIPSLRYSRLSKKYFSNKVFLPMVFLDKNLSSYKKNLQYILDNVGLVDIEKMIVQNHPLMNNSTLHKSFIDFFEEYKKNMTKNKIKIKKESKNVSIFISTTASIIEALEHDVFVIHICVNENLEAYNPYIWKDIKIRRLKKNVFLYKLKKKNSYINYNNKNKKKFINRIFN